MKAVAASGNAPADLIWAAVRKQNSFLVKRDHGRTRFSAEQGNLRNEHSFKQSGLANVHTVGVAGTKRKEHKSAFSITLKSRLGRNHPAKLFKSRITGRDLNRDFRRLARGLTAQVHAVRPDLVRDSLSRLSNLHRVVLKARALRKAKALRKRTGTAAPAHKSRK